MGTGLLCFQTAFFNIGLSCLQTAFLNIGLSCLQTAFFNTGLLCLQSAFTSGLFAFRLLSSTQVFHAFRVLSSKQVFHAFRLFNVSKDNTRLELDQISSCISSEVHHKNTGTNFLFYSPFNPPCTNSFFQIFSVIVDLTCIFHEHFSCTHSQH